MMQQMLRDAPPQKTMLTKLAEKAVDTAANLVVGGVSAAAASDVAHRAASAYVGGGYLGEEIVGPSAAIMGGFVGGTVSSAAYNSLPSKDTIQAIRQEVCPKRQIVRINPQRGPLIRSMDDTVGGHVAMELRNQKALLAMEVEARRKAEIKTANA